MSGRLLRIETRRGAGLWLLLALPLFFWLHRELPQIAPFWFQTSLTVRDGVTIVGPLLAGVAAWLAGREARRGLGELLRTTPRPAFARRLVAYAGVALCGLAVYCLIGLAIVAFSWSRASWGGPIVGPMLVGLVAVPVYGALGFAVGRRLPSRFTPPLVVLALLFLQTFVGQQREWYAFLSPVVSINGAVWWGIQPDLAAQQSLFLLSVGGAALASLALMPPFRRPAVLGVVACALLVVGSMALVWHDAPIRGGQELSTDPRYRSLPVIPYEPVCAAAPLPVCVHPAYRATLADNTATLNRLIAPILGLPGVPTRAEQGYPGLRADQTGETLWFSLYGQPEYLPLSSMQRLVRDPYAPREAATRCPVSDPQSCTSAQAVIGRWLLRRVGIADERSSGFSPNTPASSAAIDRFAALDATVQRDWLAAHFADMRAGRVPLEELP
jgi:hypothetical protein